MQQTAEMTVKASALPAPFTNAAFEKLIGLRLRVFNTDMPDHYVYEVISAEEQWDERWGFQYHLYCKVIQDTEAQLSNPEDPARH